MDGQVSLQGSVFQQPCLAAVQHERRAQRGSITPCLFHKQLHLDMQQDLGVESSESQSQAQQIPAALPCCHAARSMRSGWQAHILCAKVWRPPWICWTLHYGDLLHLKAASSKSCCTGLLPMMYRVRSRASYTLLCIRTDCLPWPRECALAVRYAARARRLPGYDCWTAAA